MYVSAPVMEGVEVVDTFLYPEMRFCSMAWNVRRAGVSDAAAGPVAELCAIIRPSLEKSARGMFARPILPI